MRDILNWGVWALLVFYTLVWSFGCFSYIKAGKGISFGSLNTTMLWWLIVIWSLFVPGFNKLHIIWLAPIVIPITTVATTWLALQNISQFIGLVALFGIYAGLLKWLSP